MIPGIILDDSSLKYYFDAAYSARKRCGKPLSFLGVRPDTDIRTA